MILETSAWKIHDPEWVKKREEDWPVFERWLIGWYSVREGRLLDPSMVNAKKFYFSGELDLDVEVRGSIQGVTYEAATILVPDLTVANARWLINFYYTHGKREDLKGYFRHYFLERLRYLDLINSGVLSEEFMLALLEGAYGHSMDEAGEILGFDPKTQYLEVFKSVGGKLLGYCTDGESDATTYDIACYMLPFYLETLSKLTDDEARQCDLRFSTILKSKKRIGDLDLVEDSKRREFIERYYTGTQSLLTSMPPYMREKISPLFD